MTDQVLSQKDLELIDDKPATDDAGDKGAKDVAEKAPDGADKAADKGGDKAPAKSGNLFDGLDDDDAPDDKGEKADPAKKADDATSDKSADGKPADEKPDDAGEKDKKEADTAWRERAMEKILAPLKDKLSVKKFEQRRDQVLKQLGRFKSVEDAIASGMLAQEKLRSGDHKRPPEDGDAEAVAKWRKENDIPEGPEKYDIPAVAGHTWTDQDQPLLDSFRVVAHEANLTQAMVNRLVDWQIKDQQRVAEEMDRKLKEADAEDKDACYDAIRTEFGVSEFKPNMAVMKRLIEDDEVFGGEGNAARIMSARYYDEETGTWRRLTSVPEIARGLIGLGLERYGDGAMPAGDGRQNAGQSRLDEINKIMATDIDRYYREGLADEALAIQQKVEARANRRAGRAAR